MGKEGQSLSAQVLTKKSYLVSKPSKTGAWGKRKAWMCIQLRMVGFVFGLLGSFFLFDSLMLSVVHHVSFRKGLQSSKARQAQDGGTVSDINAENTVKLMHERLVKFASASLSKKLRCKCNFHALKFAPRIQKIGSLLVRRIRKYDYTISELDNQLLGEQMESSSSILAKSITSGKPLTYLALHLRFEMDMAAYSACDFGGGEKEARELQAYREIHFPALVTRMKENGSSSPAELRRLGRCPMTPEEAALMLSALGFRRRTYIYLAGSDVYGGRSRMLPFTGLYPNLVKKEDLLRPRELAPFRNFSSQLAALDFIACAAADVFAMTDSGSQLSSLVTGFRTYHGRGEAPNLRPNKRKFAGILSEIGGLGWVEFQERVKKMIEENRRRVQARRTDRSIYRQPNSPECMCRVSDSG